MNRPEIWWTFAATALLLIAAGVMALAAAQRSPDLGAGLDLVEGGDQ